MKKTLKSKLCNDVNEHTVHLGHSYLFTQAVKKDIYKCYFILFFP